MASQIADRSPSGPNLLDVRAYRGAMTKLRVGLLAAVALAALAALPSMAFADEPRMEVRSPTGRCDQPFEVTATGLEPSKPVLVSFTFGGKTLPDSLGGTSEPDGRFFSPVPRVLLPCVEGGTVTASIKVDGKLLALTAQFKVGAPGDAPTAPAVGNSAPAKSGRGPDLGLMVVAVGLMLGAGCAVLRGRERFKPAE